MQQNSTFEGVMLKTTNGVAAVGVLSPAWLPSLNDVSQMSALMLPIISLFWLIFQIVRSFRNGKSKAVEE